MPQFRFTIKHNVNSNSIVLTKGMSVEIPTLTNTNPLLVNGGQIVADAFMRIYGVDIKKAGVLNTGYLEVKIHNQNIL